MIRPPGFRGAAFTTAEDGDMRSTDRGVVSATLGIDTGWATVRQVHGDGVHVVSRAGEFGDGDGLVTTTSRLPVAIFTADCVPVVVETTEAVGVAHAGWRGIVAGVVGRLVDIVSDGFGTPVRAAIGPAIQSCCFEVGDEVADRFPEHITQTTWGTTSVDLAGAIGDELSAFGEVWSSTACTRCSDDHHSHRRDRTKARMAAIGWMP